MSVAVPIKRAAFKAALVPYLFENFPLSRVSKGVLFTEELWDPPSGRGAPLDAFSFGRAPRTVDMIRTQHGEPVRRALDNQVPRSWLDGMPFHQQVFDPTPLTCTQPWGITDCFREGVWKVWYCLVHRNPRGKVASLFHDNGLGQPCTGLNTTPYTYEHLNKGGTRAGIHMVAASFNVAAWNHCSGPHKVVPYLLTVGGTAPLGRWMAASVPKWSEVAKAPSAAEALRRMRQVPILVQWEATDRWGFVKVEGRTERDQGSSCPWLRELNIQATNERGE